MTQLCELNQIGKVGKVKEVGKNLMVSVASDASFKKDGEWQNRTHWIEHTIFERQDATIKWARENLKPGDLVHVRSTAFQSEWEKDGQTHYGVTFAVDQLTRLAKRTEKDGEAAPQEPKVRGKKPR